MALLLGCRLTSSEPETPESVVSPSGTVVVSIATPVARPATPTLAPVLPSPTTAPTALNSPTPIPTPTAIPTLTSTPIPWMERTVIGYSVQGRPIEVVRLGVGERWFVALAAIHGGQECNTNGVAEGIVSPLTAEPVLLPEDVTLYVVPLVNVDGCALNSRYNANGVDLNRNWATNDWTADAEGPGGVIAGSGGAFPFSEPETAALQGWLLTLRQQSPGGDLRIVSYHSVVPETGLAQPAYSVYGQPEPRSEVMAQTYAEVTGYLYSAVWVGTYTITGEMIHWAGENGFIAMDVELPDQNSADSVPNGRTETHIETNLRGLLAIMEQE
ncbi:MAG: M14 family zinc carboxypeptidase [Candidatus Promineifilaceae bacterium]